MKTITITDEQYEELSKTARDLGTQPDELIAAVVWAVQGNPIGLADAPIKELVARLTSSLEPIQTTPGVMGGVPCVRATRIPIWLLVSLRRQGLADGELLRAYPQLDASDLLAAWSYYAGHSEQIDSQIEAQAAEDLIG